MPSRASFAPSSSSILGVIWLIPVYLLIVNASKSPELRPARVVDPERLLALPELRGGHHPVRARRQRREHAVYAIVSPAIAVLVGAAAGFAIVALRLKHGFAWFVFIFGGSIFPLQMIMLPLFDSYSRVGLYDDRLGIILVYTAISIPFAAFVMRNFFTGISHNVFEAAVVDGASSGASSPASTCRCRSARSWRSSSCRPPSSGTTCCSASRCPSRRVRPIVTTLAGMQNTYGGAQLSTVLAGGIIVSLPTVVLFLLHAALLRPRPRARPVLSPPISNGALVPLPTIPTVDDLAADVITHHYDDMIAPPGLTNLLGTVVSATTCRGQRGDLPADLAGRGATAALFVDGRLFESTACPSRTRGGPTGSCARATVGARIETTTVCVPGETAVAIDVRVRNEGAADAASRSRSVGARVRAGRHLERRGDPLAE